jgi:hypothetical protein
MTYGSSGDMPNPVKFVTDREKDTFEETMDRSTQ